ncbi:MAG TPA: YchJ family metal-binding protein [Holophagaceae bacterium]|nr:YchJ family metal-binding protein [Holophagaceae bacterium]
MSRPCPCLSNATFEKCCGPYIEGKKFPETAELLMRSRFSAYALAKADYLIATTASEKRGELDKDELEGYCRSVRCVSLKVKSTEKGKAGDDTGVVTFHASLQVNGKRHLHIEKSQFIREDGRWMYLDGVTN